MDAAHLISEDATTHRPDKTRPTTRFAAARSPTPVQPHGLPDQPIPAHQDKGSIGQTYPQALTET
jgi:hypothetical protein